MIQTVEAVVDATGHVRLLGEVRVDAPRRALVTVLDEPAIIPGEAAPLAEATLAMDWSKAGGGCRVVVPFGGSCTPPASVWALTANRTTQRACPRRATDLVG
jgi:hypothetical protein